MLNREVFYEDPGTRALPNLGVARVTRPDSDQEWDKLRFELSHFVSDGEYGQGLDRALSTFLNYIGQSKQPAVWVSGFYGSGKSHFLRVLEHIWTDTALPDGSTARGVTSLTQDVKDDLRDLATAGKRAGGLWAAAGTLGAGANTSVRLAFMRVLFEAAGLPSQYAPACLVIWLKQNGLYADVVDHVEKAGKSMETELKNLYVAQALPEALLAVKPDFAADAAAVRGQFKAQYPHETDIDETEMLQVMRDVLELQSTTPGQLPLTLVILDEVQQYLGDDAERTLTVDNMVQAVSSEFLGHVAFVAAGQSAMGGTSALMKLKDRFTVSVQLSDQDVEAVIRQVVLRKAPDKVSALKSALDQASGEIGSHLGGTTIAATSADGEHLVADYPILPTRRRFWEHLLRAVDRGGAHSQLRTQLGVAHEAVQSVADRPLDTVVGADFIYDKQVQGMLQSGVLTKDIYEAIEGLRGGAGQHDLGFRIAATVFMIDQLRQARSDTGVVANDTTIADLLVENLAESSASFRNQVKETLAALAEEGHLMRTDGAYALVSKVPQEWLADFHARRNAITGDSARVAGAREDAVRSAVIGAVGNLTILQGKSKTPRKVRVEFGAQSLAFDGSGVPVWVRSEWDVTEKTARQEAAALGTDSPVVTVFLPKLEADTMRTQVARRLAAQETIDSRPAPATEEGIQAKKAIETERDAAQAKIDIVVSHVVEGAKVFLGGGSDAGGPNLRPSVERAATDALVRLFPQFGIADLPASSWQTVSSRVLQGSSDALKAVSYDGPPEKHAVVKEVLAFLKASGTKGTDVRQKFMSIGYGWPQDAVDAALLVLVQSGLARAEFNGSAVGPKQLNLTQVGKLAYRPETILVTAGQRVEIRGTIGKLTDIKVASGDESAGVARFLQHMVELAGRAGGAAPLPPTPDKIFLKSLQQQTGNEQLLAFLAVKTELESVCADWNRREQLIAQRQPRWDRVRRLQVHGASLPIGQQVAPQLDAIEQNRALLDDPDPVVPLVQGLEEALRAALKSEAVAFQNARESGITELSADESFRALPEEQGKAIVTKCELGATDMPKIETDESLLRVLDQTPLSHWADRTASLQSRFERARQIAAAELEPKIVSIKAPKATLKSKSDADAYVESLRAEIMKQIDAGHPVVI
jgi:hypothetical protein